MIYYILLILIGLSLLTLGLLISYKDFKFGIIKNKYILLILFFGLIYQFIIINIFEISIQIFSVIIYGIIVSFIFWWLGLWPAGDAKFFISLLLFFPIQLYSTKLIFDFLTNIFVPIFIFMMISLLMRSRTKLFKGAIKYSFNPYKIFMIGVMLTGFVYFILNLMSLSGFNPDFFTAIIILFFVFEIFYSFSSVKTEIVYIGFVIFRIIIDYKNILTLNFLYNLSSTLFVFIFFRFFVLYLSYHMYTVNKKISDLKPGMSLAEGIIKKNKVYEKISFLNTSFIDSLSQKKENFVHNLERLSKNDVKKIKTLKKKGELNFDSISINQKQHFAIFILLGFIITSLIKTNFIHYLVLALK